MKNRLFAAFLTLATIPFFADQATITQPNNDELLTHLTQIKTELEAASIEVISMTTKMAETAGQQYKEIEHATSELYNLVADSISSDIDKVFDALCTQIKPLAEIEISDNSIAGAFEHLFKDNFIENHKQEIESILTKYNKNAVLSQDKDASDLQERIVNYFFTSPDSIMIAMMVAARETCSTLLQKIDTKIAELA